MDTQQDELHVEVFRAGDYGPKGVYTPEDLDRIAGDYDPATHEAPVTVDHEQKGPAHGWVARLSRLGDRLVATIARLSPALTEALRSQAYKKRSIELYRQLPSTGRPYLKAVSFLGATAPEVKGLADPAFAAGVPDVVSFEEENATRDFAEEARTHLMSTEAWRPEWETAGIPELFRALGDESAAQLLIHFLESLEKPVPFGRQATSRAAGLEAFADDLVGGASPQSAARHESALRLMAGQPELDYREALLRTAKRV